MKVTPLKRKFGRYLPGEEFDLPDNVARVFIRAKKVEQVGYETRALVAGKPAKMPASVEVDSAGVAWDASLHTSTKLKNSDGTWRKKPGRAAG